MALEVPTPGAVTVLPWPSAILLPVVDGAMLAPWPMTVDPAFPPSLAPAPSTVELAPPAVAAVPTAVAPDALAVAWLPMAAAFVALAWAPKPPAEELVPVSTGDVLVVPVLETKAPPDPPVRAAIAASVA